MSDLEEALKKRQNLEARLTSQYPPMLHRAVIEAYCDWGWMIPDIAVVAHLPVWRVRELIRGKYLGEQG